MSSILHLVDPRTIPPIRRAVVRIAGALGFRWTSQTGPALSAGIAFLKAGGSHIGAAARASLDPVAQEVFVRAIRESGL